MARLHKKRWLRRRRAKEDGRAYAVNLTDKGRSLLRKALPLVRKVDEQILAAQPGRKGEQFIEVPVAIVKTLEEKNSGALWAGIF